MTFSQLPVGKPFRFAECWSTNEYWSNTVFYKASVKSFSRDRIVKGKSGGRTFLPASHPDPLVNPV